MQDDDTREGLGGKERGLGDGFFFGGAAAVAVIIGLKNVVTYISVHYFS